MRFVHLADIHIGANYKNRSFFNWENFEKTIKEIINISPDFVLISGDLFDKLDIKPEDLLKTIQILQKLKNKDIPIFTIEGNHDYDNLHLTYYDLLSKMNLINNLSSGGRRGLLKSKYESEYVNFKEIKFKDNISYLAEGNFNGITIRGLAYIKDRKIRNGLIDRFYKKKGDILMLHQTVTEVSGFPEEISDINLAKLLELDYNYFALGHIHSSNFFSNYNFNNKYVIYSGSIERYRKNEFNKLIIRDTIKEIIFKERKKGFILFDDKEIEFIESFPRNYFDVFIEFKDLEDLKNKLNKLYDYNIEKMVLTLESLVYNKRGPVIRLLEDFQDKIIDLDIILPDIKKEIKEEIVDFKRDEELEEIIRHYSYFKQIEKNNEIVKEKIKSLIFSSFKNDLKNNEIKKEIKKIKKEENKIEKKGIFKFIS